MYYPWHSEAWVSLILGALYLIAAMHVLVRDKRVTGFAVVLYLTEGVVLATTGFLGLQRFLPLNMVSRSITMVIGIVTVVDAIGRMCAPPADRTRWWFVAAGGVIIVFYGLVGYHG